MGLKNLKNILYKLSAIRGNVAVGRNFHVGPFSRVWAPDHLEIGNDVYIGKYCTIEINGRIGNGVLIANSVGLVGRQDHDYRQIGKVISRVRWVGDGDYFPPKNDLVIEDDVWVGYGACLLSGINIGKGAIVTAGAVVVKDVDPYQIVGGNPARCVGYRFQKEEQELHEEGLELYKKTCRF
jgi:acetyltransferase-like isoleucine patch superfamily enzyme